jgi:hypothetical protein
VPTDTATSTLPPDTATPTGVPTGTAALTAPVSQSAQQPCQGLGGAASALCRTYCALDCNDGRFPCQVIRYLFHRAGGDRPLTCTVMPAQISLRSKPGARR